MPQPPLSHPDGKASTEPLWTSAFSSILERSIAETVELCRTESAATLVSFLQGSESLINNLSKSRKHLADTFAKVRENPQETPNKTVERLQAELDAQRSWLLKKVRPPFDQHMKKLSPERKPILGLLEKLMQSARVAIDTLPAPQEPPAPPAEANPAKLLQRLNRGLSELSGIGQYSHLDPRERVRLALPSEKTLQRNPLVLEYGEMFAQTEAKSADLWSSLRFHFLIAKEELDTLHSDPNNETALDFAAGMDEAERLSLAILDAAIEQFTSQTQILEGFWNTLCERLQEESAEIFQPLTEALSGHHPATGIWSGLGRTFKQQRERLQHLIIHHREAGTPLNLLALSKAALGGLQEVLPKDPGTQEKLLKLTDLPSTADVLKRTSEFPHLYRRLFTLGPLKTREFLVARDEELKTLDEAFRRWEKGKACSLALIGPEGSGKTSLANCFASEYGARGNLLRFELEDRLSSEREVIDLFCQWFAIEDPVESLDTLLPHLLARPRGMLLIEGGHNLMLRTVGGSLAAEAFLFLILATRRHFLWLITFRRIPWTRMDYQFGISRFFTHQLFTLLADQQEIRQALLLRQRISGYPIDFMTNSAEETTPPGKEEHRKREDQFFREIFSASGGNLDAAFYYWLLCLEFDNESKRFRACHLGKIDFSFLRELDRDQLFTLAEVLGHGVLSTPEHGAIFHCDLLTSRLQLCQLSSLGLLLADSPNGVAPSVRYRLNPVYYTPVIGTLESLHILY